MRRWDSTPHATISEPFSECTAHSHRVRRGHKITCTDLIPPGSIIAVLHDGPYVNDPAQDHPEARRWFVRCDERDRPWAAL